MKQYDINKNLLLTYLIQPLIFCTAIPPISPHQQISPPYPHTPTPQQQSRPNNMQSMITH